MGAWSCLTCLGTSSSAGARISVRVLRVLLLCPLFFQGTVPATWNLEHLSGLRVYESLGNAAMRAFVVLGCGRLGRERRLGHEHGQQAGGGKGTRDR
ncbi:hypothetical protein HDV57DRAFT_157406 [Trichoderma longibrachiatum]